MFTFLSRPPFRTACSNTALLAGCKADETHAPPNQPCLNGVQRSQKNGNSGFLEGGLLFYTARANYSVLMCLDPLGLLSSLQLVMGRSFQRVVHVQSQLGCLLILFATLFGLMRRRFGVYKIGTLQLFNLKLRN